MEWLTSLYPAVRQALENAIPNYWSELRPIFADLFTQSAPLPPVAILPLINCQAVNGQARDAVPVSAALIAAEVSLRISDDLQDKDRPQQLWEQIGEARAWNYAAALQALSFEILSRSAFSPQIILSVSQLFIEAYLHITAGQERDLAGMADTIEAYWRTMELKTATAFSAACKAGAMVGSDDPQLMAACHAFGHHVGLAVQIFNDMESIWQPDGTSDLKRGKITLPLMYGLVSDHPERDELLSLVTANNVAAHADRIKQILEHIDTKGFLIWAALKEREQALNSLTIIPNDVGREALEFYVTGMFGDVDALLQEQTNEQV